MSLKRFFAYSIAAHTLIIIAVVFLMPVVKEKETGGELFARLVSPNEFLTQVPFTPAIPKVRSAPHARPRAITSAPVIEGNSKIPEKEISPSPSPLPPASQSQGIERRPESKGTPQKPGVLPEVPPSLREKLFDRSIIGEFAKRELEKEKKEKTLGFDVKDLRYLAYLQRLKERIESIWIYPPDAATQGIYGDLVIKFTIKKNGRLGAVDLVRTSGHKNLDDAALKALRDAEPFWPLPDEWGMEAYSIEGHFIYTIYGFYIR